MTTQKKTRIMPRFEEDGRVLLAFPDHEANPGNVEVYEKCGQHSEANRAYIRLHTKPATPSNPAVSALVKEWCFLGPSDVQVNPENVEYVTLSDMGKYW